MKSIEDIYMSMKGYFPVKQFAEPLEAIEVICTVSIEDAMRMNREFQETCDLIRAEECQSLPFMNDIVASGQYTKKLSNFKN